MKLLVDMNLSPRWIGVLAEAGVALAPAAAAIAKLKLIPIRIGRVSFNAKAAKLRDSQS